MKKTFGVAALKAGVVYFLAGIFMAGFSACASAQKTAKGPEAAPAAVSAAPQPAATEQVKPDSAVQGTVENQPSPEELALRQKEERDRQAAESERSRRDAEARWKEAAVMQPQELGKVYFDFDKYKVKPEFRDVLMDDSRKIESGKGKTIVIEGHCDERGSEAYNMALGQRRATAVKNYLISIGVDPNRLSTISYGAERPASAGHDEAAWSKNRRAQFNQ